MSANQPFAQIIDEGSWRRRANAPFLRHIHAVYSAAPETAFFIISIFDAMTLPQRIRASGALVALLAALAACGPDTSQADLCERVVDKLYGGPGTLTLVKTETIAGDHPRVAVQFRPTSDKSSAPLTITCTFAGKDGNGQLDLIGVRRPNNRPLHLVSVIFLKHQLMNTSSR